MRHDLGHMNPILAWSCLQTAPERSVKHFQAQAVNKMQYILIRDAGVQVYVSVYADGPTRVLRFADEKSTALLEAEQSILDLAARLKQVCNAITNHYYPMYRVVKAASLHVTRTSY